MKNLTTLIPDDQFRRTATFGLIAFFLFFVVGGLYATFVPLKTSAVASGVVSVSSSRKTIQHFEGGIVQTINISDGAIVKAGDALIVLDNTQSSAQFSIVRDRLNKVRVEEARLLAEQRGDDVFTPPEDEFQTPPQDYASLVSSQMRMFETRRDTMKAKIEVMQSRALKTGDEITGLRRQIKAEGDQLALLETELIDVQDLVAKGLARKPRMLALQRRQSEIEGSRGQNEARIARAEQEIAETKLAILEYESQIQAMVSDELSKAQSSMLDLQERFIALKDVYERTIVRAPTNGTIVGLNVHTVGGTIGAGQALMDIVPTSDHLIVDLMVHPNDIDVVRKGLKARVRFTAFAQRNLLPAEGVVLDVSADRLVDEKSGVPYFKARVRLNEGYEKALDGEELYPGMQADAMIVTGETTILWYIIEPLIRSFERAFRS